ncbi:unnamed protein product, partial [Dovyalis caffra]
LIIRQSEGHSCKITSNCIGCFRRFYDGLNSHDLVTVEELIAENCVYEDLIFPRPCVGRKAVLEFFQQFFDSTSTDLDFVIDDISGEDSLAVGVIWHLGQEAARARGFGPSSATMLITSIPSSLLSSNPLTLHFSKTPTSTPPLTIPHASNIFTTTWTRSITWTPQTLTKVSSSNHQTVTVATSSPTSTEDVSALKSAPDVVKGFYEGINGHDLASVEELIAENCVYEDLIFPRPFVGRQVAIRGVTWLLQQFPQLADRL